MLDKIRRGQRWLTMLLVGAIGFVFVVFFGPWAGQQAPTSALDSVVEVDDIVIDTSDFFRRRERQSRQLSEQLGEEYDEKAARPYVDQQVLRALVEQAVLAHSAREVGIRVTRKEIQTFLRDTYRNADGSFDQELIVDLIENEYGTQRVFLETIEREFLATKMVQLLYSQARVSESELDTLVHHASDEVHLAMVRLDTAALPDGEDVDPERIEAFLAANGEALRARYDQEIDRYTTPERARARHLLIELPESADETAEASARDEAEAARKRIADGESFADVARAVSDDRGTRDSGGELGLVSRQEMANSVGDAAFDLEPGNVSEVVRGSRGYHVVLLEEKVPGGTRSYEDVSQELAREGALLELARERADGIANELADAVRAGASLEDAARERDLTLIRTGAVRRRADGFIPDLGSAPEVLALAFALEEGKSSPRIFEVGNRIVMIQSISKSAPDELELTSQIAGARSSVLGQKRNQIVRAWIDEQQQRLEANGLLRVNAALVIGS